MHKSCCDVPDSFPVSQVLQLQRFSQRAGQALTCNVRAQAIALYHRDDPQGGEEMDSTETTAGCMKCIGNCLTVLSLPLTAIIYTREQIRPDKMKLTTIHES